MGVPMITIAQARAAGACSDGVERAREHVTWDEDQPIPLADILKYSMEDALWSASTSAPAGRNHSHSQRVKA